MPDARLLLRADLGVAAQNLADAFSDDPVWRYLAPSDNAWSRAGRSMLATEIVNRLRHGGVYATEGLESVAVWAPPGSWRFGWADVAREAPAAMRLFGARGSLRAMRYQSKMEQAHPDDRPHWYLAVLGTAPAQQGHGFASTALAPVLRRCDDEGVPAYLESSKEQNLAFYARHRFVAGDALEVLPGAPPVWPMWREPASP